MKSNLGLSSDWMNVVDAERNQIVFLNRNKDFGAFKIRKEYNHTLFLSLFIASAFFIAIPSLLNFLGSQQKTEPSIWEPQKDQVYELINIPVKPLEPSVQLQKEETRVSTPHEPVPIVVNEIISTPATEPTSEKITPKAEEGKNGVAGENLNEGTNVQPLIVEEKSEPNVFIAVSEMPVFPGGDNELLGFLRKNTQYPNEDKLIGNQGTVFVYFVIDKNGRPINIKIANPTRGKENLEKEAMRVISKMPAWTPGKQNGKPAMVSFTLPIRFVSK
jgi:protein TonB